MDRQFCIDVVFIDDVSILIDSCSHAIYRKVVLGILSIFDLFVKHARKADTASQILRLYSDNQDPSTKLEASHRCFQSLCISPSEIRGPKYFATPLHQSSRLSKYTWMSLLYWDIIESHDSTDKAT
jgi:hypothetical protein